MNESKSIVLLNKEGRDQINYNCVKMFFQNDETNTNKT